MEVYLTEEERLEALKRWWKANANSIVWGVALGIAVIVGWGAWKRSQEEKALLGGTLYQQLLDAVANKQTEAAIQLGERIDQQFPGSAYATYGKLFLVRLKVEADDLAGAKTLLQQLIASAKDEKILQIARLRLAEIQLGLGETEEALRRVESLTGGTPEFAALREELKGDIYLALNRPEEARAAYLKARREGQPSPLLELKLTDLGTPATR
ncbi:MULTISPECIES: YfgM family protein [Methylococcus]|uniref:Ancillary SecYEG translocon subunit n=1 Tax=Methylococcus capsulatus TaxID=414 RepID=A0ABZ2F6M9_METCP|nr:MULTISPECIES: tetratricopeptide repeat protein [Methylococcus]MDF9393661.1 tetratricopeptide repeat protein [Methylococcus capsulatus]